MNQELREILKQTRRKNSKYSAKSCRCMHDHSHDSRDEARYCEQIYIEKQQGYIADIKREPHYDLCVNGKKIVGHQPDWLITYPSGSQGIREFKGFATEKWKIQKRLFEALYPELPYEVVTKKDLWW